MSKCRAERSPRKTWTRDEEAVIRRLYARAGRRRRRVQWEKILRALPGRTRDAIKSHAHAMRCASRGTGWGRREERTLTRLWGEDGERALMDALPGRTWIAITRHAEEMGLPMGMPQGFVTPKEAARRLGCDGETVMRLAARAGVPVTRQTTARHVRGTQRAKGFRARLMVEWDKIREACERELQLETVAYAAERVGVPRATLRRWIYEADVLAPCPEGRTRRDIRLDPALVDAVVARRRGGAAEGAEPTRRAA